MSFKRRKTTINRGHFKNSDMSVNNRARIARTFLTGVPQAQYRGILWSKFGGDIPGVSSKRLQCLTILDPSALGSKVPPDDMPGRFDELYFIRPYKTHTHFQAFRRQFVKQLRTVAKHTPHALCLSSSYRPMSVSTFSFLYNSYRSPHMWLISSLRVDNLIPTHRTTLPIIKPLSGLVDSQLFPRHAVCSLGSSHPVVADLALLYFLYFFCFRLPSVPFLFAPSFLLVCSSLMINFEGSIVAAYMRE